VKCCQVFLCAFVEGQFASLALFSKCFASVE
jgi:hypothetical protein